jgi:protein-S-isoprenylcysteine O-methyltransferase Ste14
MALFVLPWIGFLFDTWLGVLIGIIMYIGSRIFLRGEEEILSKTFGAAWDEGLSLLRSPRAGLRGEAEV